MISHPRVLYQFLPKVAQRKDLVLQYFLLLTEFRERKSLITHSTRPCRQRSWEAGVVRNLTFCWLCVCQLSQISVGQQLQGEQLALRMSIHQLHQPEGRKNSSFTLQFLPVGLRATFTQNRLTRGKKHKA